MSKSLELPQALQAVIKSLRALPGVGPRSAERMTLWMLDEARRSEALALAEAIQHSQTAIDICPNCGFFRQEESCSCCQTSGRRSESMCVVATAMDIIAIEKTGVFQGQYHALGGLLSPLNSVGPEQLKIEALLQRLGAVKEVILALSADVEGEATCYYLAERLKTHAPEVKVSRVAHGLPAGLGLEFADQLTLNRALQGRVSL